jgi:hypothetical protein
MDGATQVKSRVFRREFAGEDEISVFETADPTKTHRTYIPAPITFDALIELVHPVMQPFILAQLFVLSQSLAVGNSLGLLSHYPFQWIRLIALTSFSQFRRAGNADGDDSIPTELIPLEELVQSSLITSPHHDPQASLGVPSDHPKEYFIQGIPYVPYHEGF